MEKILGSTFMLVIFVFGLFILSRGVKHSYGYAASSKWETVSAQVDSVAIDAGYSRRRKSSKSSHSNTRVYETTGSYSYVFEGQSYSSSRVFLNSGRSSDYEEQKGAYDEMKRAQKTGDPISVFVNPKNPSQALVYRKFNWILLFISFLLGTFVTLIGGVGLRAALD